MIVQSEESLRLYALGALAWLAFVAFILVGFFTSVKQAPFVAIPFFGVFLFIAWKAAGKLLGGAGAYVNFGTVRLVLEHAPLVGGELKGAVEFETGAAALAKLEAELVCAWEVAKRPGDAAVLKGEARRETSVLAVHAEPGHRRAPFAFAIPVDASPSGEADAPGDEDRPPTYTWELRLNAPNAGGDLARRFVVEVLPAGASPAQLAAQGPAAESGIALVAANFVPLAMVLLGWGSAGGLVVLYWAENVVIGFYTVLRMLESGRGSLAEKIGKSFFFCLHYGMFCLVHGVFVATLFLPREQQGAMYTAPTWPGPLVLLQPLWQGASAMGLFSPRALLLPLLALIVSHGVSFYTNYLRNGRYLRSRPDDSFMRPYGRMFLLHVFIIGGGFFVAQHAAVLPLAALVVGKTVMDLLLHRRSNRAL